MPIATIHSVSDFIEVIVSAVSVLGGFMALWSGSAASRSVRANQEPGDVARRVNEGLAVGFEYGLPAAVLALILLGLS
jgi:hypothetical protein